MYILQRYCLLLLISLTACHHTAKPLSDQQEFEIKRSVMQSFNGLVEAAKSLDVPAYLAYFDEVKFTALNENGTVEHSLIDFARIYQEQIPAIQEYLSLEFDQIKITVINATTAVLVNEYDAQLLLKTGDQIKAAGGGTQVWSMAGGTWKLVSVSSSTRR